MSTTVPPRPRTKLAPRKFEAPQGDRPESRPTGIGRRWQAALLAIAVGVVPTVTIGGLAAWMLRHDGIRNAEQQQLAQTQLLADRLQGFLAERARDAELVANLAVFAEADRRQAAAQKQVLNQLVAESEAVGAAFLDPQGNPLAQSDTSPLPALGDRGSVQQAIQSRQVALAALDTETNAPGQVELVAPVIDRASGQPVGVIWMQIPLAAIAPLFERHLDAERGWYIFTGAGELVAGSQPDYLGRTVDQSFAGIAAQHTSRQPSAAVLPSPSGDTLVSYAPVESIDGLGDPDLGTLLTVPAIALSPPRQMGLLLLATAAAAAAGAIALVWFARRRAAPLMAATQAIENLRQGEFDSRLLVRGEGEVAVLNATVNQLAQHLQGSFASLEQTQAELEQQLGQHTTALDDRAKALQHEVEQLLSAFSSVRMGDLTVTTADLTAIDPVADAFNQCVERLGQILAAVSEIAAEVTEAASGTTALVVDTVGQAEQQVLSVSQVQALVETMLTLSRDNRQQVTVTVDAIAHSQTAVAQGQQDIDAMNRDVDSLQRETQQIVGRAQTLTSYFDLASQFVKDQNRIAALTRVLALNASMLSTRASEQQDPAQFAAVTREFETVASQVNDLADQTNQSLVVLQRRTEQIQTVVSGLNHDVEDISQQADSLTAGIGQSSLTFSQIRAAMAEATTLGPQVTQASQAIADGVKTTLESVQAIAAIATATAAQAYTTQRQSETTAAIARRLSRNVTYFQLPPASALPETVNDAATLPAPDPDDAIAVRS
ncbi:MAG: methyl-accepting chemotaxis protein [Nodosilinea sp.]